VPRSVAFVLVEVDVYPIAVGVDKRRRDVSGCGDVVDVD